MFDWWKLPQRDELNVKMPEPTWPVYAEIRLREIDLREKELEVRRLEALAKLEAARKEQAND